MSAAHRFLALFRPAEHAHGSYLTATAEAAPGEKLKGQATTVHGPVSVELIAQHLAGVLRCGAVPIHRDGLCWFGVIDVDKYNIDIVAYARQIKKLKLPLIVCESKSHGAHLYTFCTAIRAAAMREMLADFCGRLHLVDSEIFPKQAELKSGDDGNWINLPYFDGTCFAVNADGHRLSLEEFLTLGEALALAAPSRKKKVEAETEFDLETATELLAAHWTSERHLLALIVAGALLRVEVDHDNVTTLIAAVVAITGDDEPEERIRCVDTAARALAADRRMYGIPKLRERLGEDTEKFLAACGVESGSDSHELEDFRAYLPTHEYIFLPTRALWPAASLNATLRKVKVPGGKITAAAWLDRHRPVQQMTWAPGEPPIIEGRLVAEGGWIPSEERAVFNLYRPPTPVTGDPHAVWPWLRLLCRVWPRYARRHMLLYLAHRVQKPAEKINHALVLGGAPGIGKDTLLEPVKWGVGAWNFTEISPAHLLGRFNGYLKSVVLRVSEARDLGEVNRYSLYEHMKTLTAAPPDVLRCDEKNLKEHSVFNLAGVIITTNHRTGGIYLPADDRRHFVAWSETEAGDFVAGYWKELWRWYYAGGIANVVAFLQGVDLSAWDAKAPPAKTEAFWDVVDAERPAEVTELADVTDRLERPAALTLDQVYRMAMGMVGSTSERSELAEWLGDRKNRRQIPHRMAEVGYVPVRNPLVKGDGSWKIAGRRQVVYARAELNLRERLAAATALCRKGELIKDGM